MVTQRMEQEISRTIAEGMMVTFVAYISAIWLGRISISSGPRIIVLPNILNSASVRLLAGSVVFVRSFRWALRVNKPRGVEDVGLAIELKSKFALINVNKF